MRRIVVVCLFLSFFIMTTTAQNSGIDTTKLSILDSCYSQEQSGDSLVYAKRDNDSLSFTFQDVGLVLSGGGALGFAHIGAIKVLEEYGIEPKYVAGSSMGAIIGVLYAAGYSADDIMQIIKEERLYKVGRLITMQSAFINQGLSKHKTLLRELRELIPHNSFDSLERKFMVCVTNVERGEPEYRYSGGNLSEYVAASASIPAVFEPIKIDGSRYVDGGVTDNLPAKRLKSMVEEGVLAIDSCDDKNMSDDVKNSSLFIIAVDVLPFVENFKSKNSIDMARWALRLFQVKNMDNNRSECDWLVQSFALKEYHEFDFKYYKEIYQYGYDAMKKYIISNQEKIDKK